MPNGQDGALGAPKESPRTAHAKSWFERLIEPVLDNKSRASDSTTDTAPPSSGVSRIKLELFDAQIGSRRISDDWETMESRSDQSSLEPALTASWDSSSIASSSAAGKLPSFRELMPVWANVSPPDDLEIQLRDILPSWVVATAKPIVVSSSVAASLMTGAESLSNPSPSREASSDGQCPEPSAAAEPAHDAPKNLVPTDAPPTVGSPLSDESLPSWAANAAVRLAGLQTTSTKRRTVPDISWASLISAAPEPVETADELVAEPATPPAVPTSLTGGAGGPDRRSGGPGFFRIAAAGSQRTQPLFDLRSLLDEGPPAEEPLPVEALAPVEQSPVEQSSPAEVSSTRGSTGSDARRACDGSGTEWRAR